jgi:hypothetical protein
MSKHWNYVSAFLAFLAVSWLGLPVIGQTPASTPVQAPVQAPAETQKITIGAHTIKPVDLPEGQVVPVTLKIAGYPNAPAGMDAGLTLKGHARMIIHEGRKIGQVLVTTLANSERDVRLPGPGLTTQLDLEQAVLDPANVFKLEGEWSAMAEAARILATPVVADTKPQPAETEKSNDAETPVGAGGGGSKNDQAAAYETPERTARAATPEPVVGTQITTEGCTVRIDLAQKVAIQQSKTVTTENGTVTGEEDCSDSEVRFALDKNYLGCSDLVDVVNLTAQARFKWFYLDSGGLPQTVSTSCETDTDQTFPITEDHGACTISTDFATSQAVPQAALVYMNRDNKSVEARSCANSISKAPVAMMQSTSGCTMRHDYAANLSTEIAMWTYVLEGALYQASACADTNNTYPHSTVYKDIADAWVCPRTVNQVSNQVILQSRVQITVNGLTEFITACTPDASATGITATTDGCADPSTWTHDVASGVSYGRERWFYMFNNAREYVTECVDSATTYAHNVSITGYQNHDDQLFAYALSTVTISPPSGSYNVKTSEVLAGASQMPYVLDRTEDVANGNTSYVGCDAFNVTDNTEIWVRPDGTFYSKVIGPGAANDPRNACSLQVTSSWPRISAQTLHVSGGPGGSCDNNGSADNAVNADATYEGSKTLLREDGDTVSSITVQKTVEGCSTYCRHTASPYSGASFCPTSQSGSQVINWRNELGWW